MKRWSSSRVGPAIAWLCATIACSACTRGASGPPATSQRDSANVVIVDHDLDRLNAVCQLGDSPDVSIGSADGGPEYELYRVFGARRLSDGRIAVVNQGSQQLRFYDQEGRFVGAVGREGSGPGEFRDAFHLWVLPGDTIWVGDYRPWRFLVFAPDGRWVRTVQPEPVYPNSPEFMSVLDDGRAILGTRTRPSRAQGLFDLVHSTAVVHAPDGTLNDTLGTYPHGRWGSVRSGPSNFSMFALFESFAHVAGSGDRVFVAHGSEPEIEVFSGTPLRLAYRIRWTTGDRSVATSDIEAERRRIAEPYEDMDPGDRRRFLEPLVSDERPVADQFPAFQAIRPGRDGRIWVRQFPRPSAPEPHQWLAFDAEGRFDCRATIPAFDQLLEFGDDYILVLQRDDLGVERVLQYPLARPTEGS